MRRRLSRAEVDDILLLLASERTREGSAPRANGGRRPFGTRAGRRRSARLDVPLERERLYRSMRDGKRDVGCFCLDKSIK